MRVMTKLFPDVSHCSDRVLMVRPSRFGYHKAAAESNAFMREPVMDEAPIALRGVEEFDVLHQVLDEAGVRVLVYQDTDNLPDCLFPNNWFSWHQPVGQSPTLITYPMRNALRRAERRASVLKSIEEFTGVTPNRIELESLEDDDEILEGTGSLVLDRTNGIAFACLSERTTPRALEIWWEHTGYQTVSFDCTDWEGNAVYHTNVVLSIGRKVAIIASEMIRDEKERDRVLGKLRDTGRDIVEISEIQVTQMAGNALELRTKSGDHVYAMSSAAFSILEPEQRDTIESHSRIVHAPIPTIERIGGGSVRCMIAELGSDSVPD